MAFNFVETQRRTRVIFVNVVGATFPIKRIAIQAFIEISPVTMLFVQKQACSVLQLNFDEQVIEVHIDEEDEKWQVNERFIVNDKTDDLFLTMRIQPKSDSERLIKTTSSPTFSLFGTEAKRSMFWPQS